MNCSYYFNGSCTAGFCNCLRGRLGSYCQFDRSDEHIASISKNRNLKKAATDFSTKEFKHDKMLPEKVILQELSSTINSAGVQSKARNLGLSSDDRNEEKYRSDSVDHTILEDSLKMTTKTKKKPKLKKKPNEKEDSKEALNDSLSVGANVQDSTQKKNSAIKETSSVPNEQDLYGPGGKYPTPYAAGKCILEYCLYNNFYFCYVLIAT